jgi:hypothetical protein
MGTSTPLGPFDYPIDPAALVGCRSPAEPGCEECCIQMDDGRCDFRNDQDTNWEDFEADPWYLGRNIEDGPCPDTCSPCASCFLRTEQDLREREVRPDCDCENVGFIPDACFAPTSCECYCPGTIAEMEACPPAE